MDSTTLPTGVAPQPWYADIAAMTAGTPDADTARARRQALQQARQVLDAQGPHQVPTMVIAAALGFWQARFNEADTRLLRAGEAAEQSRWQIARVSALTASNALQYLARARGMTVRESTARREARGRQVTGRGVLAATLCVVVVLVGLATGLTGDTTVGFVVGWLGAVGLAVCAGRALSYP